MHPLKRQMCIARLADLVVNKYRRAADRDGWAYPVSYARSGEREERRSHEVTHDLQGAWLSNKNFHPK